MRVIGFNIEIIRGESANVVFNLVTPNGEPFRLMPADTFSILQARFRVKSGAYRKSLVSEEYLIDKIFLLNDTLLLKRFSDTEIIDLSEYRLGEFYDPLRFDDTDAPLDENDDVISDRLFYHPLLKEYRYYESNDGGGRWVLYEAIVTVPFEPEDTQDLDYKTYVYDLVLEASDEEDGLITYRSVLVDQHSFTVTYRV